MPSDATPGKARRLRLRFLPIVERELRIAARGRGSYRWRTAVAAVGLGFMALLTAAHSAGNYPAEVLGRSLFQTLVAVSAMYAFLASVSVTADSMSREKREGTLGLLFLTELRGRDIILGKLAANSLNTIYGLLGLLPLLAIPVMLGGVSIRAGVGATLSILNLLFVSLSLGIFVSTLSWNERRATFAAVVVGLAIMLGPLLLGGVRVFFGRGSSIAWVLSSFSPLFPLFSSLSIVSGEWQLRPLLPSHLLGWLLLINAGRLAQQAWHSRSGAPVRRSVDERVFTPRDSKARANHRRRMLDLHPLVWLQERHPAKRFYADGLVLAVALIGAWGYRTYGTDMFGGPGWFLIAPLALTVHLILASWVVAESSMRLLEDRRSGALELLLCTSLTDREIIRGKRLALRRLFLRPVLLLAMAEVFVGVTGFAENDAASRNGRLLMFAMATSIVLDTYALSWIALWLATSLPNVNRVGAFALAITPIGPALLAAVVSTTLALLPFPRVRISFLDFILIWQFFVLAVDLIIGHGLCRTAVLRHFRESAIEIQPRAAVST